MAWLQDRADGMETLAQPVQVRPRGNGGKGGAPAFNECTALPLSGDAVFDVGAGMAGVDKAAVLANRIRKVAVALHPP